MLVVVPIVDWGRGITFGPVSEPGWRFAVLQLLSNYLLTPVLGVALAMMAATLGEDWKTLRVLRLLAWLVAVFMLLGSIAFPFDALETKRAIQPQSYAVFNVGAITGLFRMLCFVAVSALLALSAGRVLKELPAESTQPANREDKLVVGR
jgi:hypothetical protein